MSTPEMIAAIKDILLAAAAIITATAAVRGLKTWHRELKGKTEFETARGFIRATYKLRDEIILCRSPFIRANEFPETYNNMDKHTTEEEAQAWAHVYKKRWEPVTNALQDFDAQTLEAEALWGQEVRKRSDKFRECSTELIIAINTTISNKASGGEDFASDKEFARETRMKVSNTLEQKNPLTQQIAESISMIEEFIRPHLKRN